MTVLQYRRTMTIFAEPSAGVTPQTAARTERRARTRHYVMTPPRFFAVDYAINPWMDTTNPVDTAVALAQWQQLREIYLQMGHTVDLVNPVRGLPDMVYAANGGLIIDGTAVVARFKHAERKKESVAYTDWLRSRGYQPMQTRYVNEGQGDLLPVGDMILAGMGFRTDPRAHDEIADIFARPVVSLELVDPRFYHLDTALTVLDDTTIAYYPPAFTYASRAHCSPRRSWSTAPTRTRSASTRCRTDVMWYTRPPPSGSPSSCPTPVSSRSASTCPSCSRAAAR